MNNKSLYAGLFIRLWGLYYFGMVKIITNVGFECRGMIGVKQRTDATKHTRKALLECNTKKSRSYFGHGKRAEYGMRLDKDKHYLFLIIMPCIFLRVCAERMTNEKLENV